MAGGCKAARGGEGRGGRLGIDVIHSRSTQHNTTQHSGRAPAAASAASTVLRVHTLAEMR